METDLKLFVKALSFAAEKHCFQRRSGYEPLPYINHLIKVSTALIEIGGEKDLDTINASLLHDVLEDTETTYEELSQQFGANVANIVLELTDDMNLPYEERKQRQIETATELSHAAKKIRIADKTANIIDIFTYPLEWSYSQKQSYLENAILVVEKMRGVHTGLENWFFDTVNTVQ